MDNSGNICKFSSAVGGDNSLFAFQFIYETMPERLGANRSYAAFVCHLVTEGEGVFRTSAGDYQLKRGDLFFAFPSLPFTLETDGNFKYLYISFVGSFASELLESIGITRDEPVRRACGELIPVWFGALERCGSDNLSLMTKGLLYYTFAHIKQSVPEERPSDNDCDSVVARIREMIERDFSNADLSLDHLSRFHQYNSKYISRRFHEILGISFSDYLTSCRIRHACVLLDESRMSIREIAAAVGYKDALYFSKVFKRVMKTTPSKYRGSKKSASEGLCP